MTYPIWDALIFSYDSMVWLEFNNYEIDGDNDKMKVGVVYGKNDDRDDDGIDLTKVLEVKRSHIHIIPSVSLIA